MPLWPEHKYAAKQAVRDVNSMGRTEQLDAHDRASERRVRRPRKDSNEAKPCEKVDRCIEQSAESMAQRRADEEQGHHLASLEAGTQRNDGEQ